MWVKKISPFFMAVAVLSLTLFAYAEAGQQAVKPAAFYQGKRIDFIIASKSGDTADLLGRLIARYLDKHIGTTSVIRNVREAAGIKGVNELYRAKPDGLTLGVATVTKLVLMQIMGQPGVQYDADKLSYILNVQSDLMGFMVAANSPYNSIASLQAAKGIKLASTSAKGIATLTNAAVAEALGLDAKIIIYKSGKEVVLSLMQGECAGSARALAAILRATKRKQVRPLFILAPQRFAVVPEVPTLRELIKLPADKIALLKLWEEELRQMRAFYAPPGMPKSRLNFLRKVANAMAKDPEFQQQVKRITARAVSVLSGQELQKVMISIMGRKAEIKQTYMQLLDKYRS